MTGPTADEAGFPLGPDGPPTTDAWRRTALAIALSMPVDLAAARLARHLHNLTGIDECDWFAIADGLLSEDMLVAVHLGRLLSHDSGSRADGHGDLCDCPICDTWPKPVVRETKEQIRD
jgi:hypothetical protein